jgi:hypothetical protein
MKTRFFRGWAVFASSGWIPHFRAHQGLEEEPLLGLKPPYLFYSELVLISAMRP